jgi:hypothetical protein
LRIGVGIGIVFYLLYWLITWPSIYEQFERWGLVKAFFAQLIDLATVLLIARISILRAGHLQVLPPDDFVNLRAVSVILRWLGEIALVDIVGTGLSFLLRPVGGFLGSIVSALSPKMAQEISSGASSLVVIMGPLYIASAAATVTLFLLFYALANAIDLMLAVEFNTRAERVGHRISG